TPVIRTRANPDVPWRMMQTRNKGQSTAAERDVSLGGADLLLLNNCPGHPSAEELCKALNRDVFRALELCTDDDEISAMFLPLTRLR
ncbi:hypothetical protein AVEN_253570-2-1, partial [Araneus ventricosus]